MPVALPPQDELLRLTGSTGNPYQTITTTFTGTGAYFGADRTIPFWLVIAGTVTGTSPTQDVKFQDSADGSSYTDRGVAFPQQTTSMASAVGNLSDFPMVSVTTRSGRPYLRVICTSGGTSPSFGSLAVLHGSPTPW